MTRQEDGQKGNAFCKCAQKELQQYCNQQGILPATGIQQTLPAVPLLTGILWYCVSSTARQLGKDVRKESKQGLVHAQQE